jgi:UvrD/REP helicase N-terminal domain
MCRFAATCASEDEVLVEAAKFFRVYEQALQEAGAIDFADMVPLVVKAITGNEAYRSSIIGAFDHLLVDEYQDVNPGQIALIDHFVDGGMPPRDSCAAASALSHGSGNFAMTDQVCSIDMSTISHILGIDIGRIQSLINRWPQSDLPACLRSRGLGDRYELHGPPRASRSVVYLPTCPT